MSEEKDFLRMEFKSLLNTGKNILWLEEISAKVIMHSCK